MTQNTLYDILGISPSATTEEIKTAFKHLAKKYHPDKNLGNTSHEDLFKKINHAYQVLSNESSKQKYDAQLAYARFQKNPPSSTNNTKTQQQKKNTTNPSNKQKQSSLKTNLIVVAFFGIIGILSYVLYTFMSKYTAEDLFKKAELLSTQRRYKEAFMVYTDAVSHYKEYPEAYEKRGVARILAIKDYEGAEGDFTNAINFSDKPTINLYTKRVKCRIRLKKYDLALSDLDNIIRLNKNYDSAYYYKGEIQYATDNFTSAITNYSTFIQQNPNTTDAYLKRGFCLLKTGDYTNALADFNKILSENPQDAETYYYRGLAYLALDEPTKGCSDLNYAYLFGFTEAKTILDAHCSKP